MEHLFKVSKIVFTHYISIGYWLNVNNWNSTLSRFQTDFVGKIKETKKIFHNETTWQFKARSLHSWNYTHKYLIMICNEGRR